VADQAKKLELTWKPHGKRKGKKVNGGRWVKVIDGKQISFGTGKRKSDKAGYNKAVAAYKTLCEQRDRDEDLAKLARAYYRGRAEAMGQEVGDLGGDASANGSVLPTWLTKAEPDDDTEPVNGDQGPTLEEVQSLIDRSKRRMKMQRPLVAAEPDELTFDHALDLYLDARKKDRDLTAQQPDVLPKRQRLTAQTYRTMENHLKSFREFAGNHPVAEAADVEKLLGDFRSQQQQLLIEGKYKPHTVNSRLRKLHTFVKWLTSNNHLDRLPRNLTDACTSFNTEKGGKPLTLEVIRELWDHANDRMKAWIALGLNCGFYPIDVGRLHRDDLQDGRVVKRRGKTGALQNYKLWPVTLELIDRTRQDSDGGGLLWVATDGTPLVSDAGVNRLSALFAKLRSSAEVEATFSQLRDTSAQQIENISRSQGRIDPALVSLFLSHKDGRTAAYYLSSDPADMETSTLDKALDQLCEYYGLEA